jgi:hypothetical protein
VPDNSVLNPGIGGDTIRDVARGSIKTQVVGQDLGIGTGTEVLAGTVTGPTNITVASAGLAVIAQGSFSSVTPTANSFVTASVPGCSVVGFGFNNTSFIGTLTFDATVDGTNWFNIAVRPQGLDTDVLSITLATGVHFEALAECAGYQQVRVRCSAYTSGTGAATLVPAAATAVSSLSTTGASSIGSVNRMGMAHTPVLTSVAAAVSSTSLLAANLNRIGATFYNDSTAVLYLALAGSASTTAYTLQVPQNGYYEVPYGYDGAIFGIWASANGSVRITELT